jgi:dTDP-4-dehydrorhamnose reductase
MKIVVTGANGQLGSEIQLLAPKYKLWNFAFSDVDTLDLTDEKAIKEMLVKEHPSFLINCAAYTAVDKAETDKKNATLINAEVPKNLARLAKKFNFKFIHISTDYVYSGKNFKPYTENDKTEPSSVYGKTKLLGEENVIHHTDALIIRTSWLYSKFGNNFVKTMLRLGSEKEKLTVVFDQIGTPTNAHDLASVILHIIANYEENLEWRPGIYNYSNEGVASWYDFAQEIMSLGKRKCKVYPITSSEYPLPAPRPAYSVLNKNKIKETYAISIPYWKDSLKEVVEFLIK